MSHEKLTRMANQIATFFDSQPDDSAPAIAAHINDFWEPRMRAQLIAHVNDGGRGLHHSVLAAMPFVRKPEAA